MLISILGICLCSFSLSVYNCYSWFKNLHCCLFLVSWLQLPNRSWASPKSRVKVSRYIDDFATSHPRTGVLTGFENPLKWQATLCTNVHFFWDTKSISFIRSVDKRKKELLPGGSLRAHESSCYNMNFQNKSILSYPRHETEKFTTRAYIQFWKCIIYSS